MDSSNWFRSKPRKHPLSSRCPAAAVFPEPIPVSPWFFTLVGFTTLAIQITDVWNKHNELTNAATGGFSRFLSNEPTRATRAFGASIVVTLWVPHHPQHQITQNQQLQVYKVKLKALSSEEPEVFESLVMFFLGKICSAQWGNTRKGWIHAPPGIGCQAAAHAWNGTGKASTTWRVMLA